jgi:hypothetical protein
MAVRDRSTGPGAPQGERRRRAAAGRGVAAPLLVCALAALSMLDARAEGEAAPAVPTATASAEAERLAPLLRSDDAAAREDAAEKLLALGEAALPALEAELGRAGAALERIRALIAVIRPGLAPASGGRAAARDRPRAPDPPPGERWYEAKFREAARRVELGDHLGAVKLLDAILVLEPDCPIRERIQQLRVRAKELQVRATLVEARLVPKRVLLAPGDPVELSLELKNVSAESLDLAGGAEGEGEIFGALEVETVDATPRGERSRVSEPQRLAASIPARLSASETWRTPLTLRPGRPLPPGVFRRLRISGSIRSRTLVRADEHVDRFLPLFAVDVFVVDPARHALAAEPRRCVAAEVERLREAKEPAEAAAAAERLFFASMLAPAEDREAVIAALGATLEREGDAAAPAAMMTLAVLLDGPLDPDRAAWRERLRRRAR